MNDLLKLIDRFQAFRAKTGAGKLSSYQLTLTFDPDSDVVELQWGCYDVADYPRMYETTTTRQSLLIHMQREIEMMEIAIENRLRDAD